MSFRWQAPFEGSLTSNFTGVGATGPTYANVAVGGNTTADCLANVATLTAQNPDHVFVMVGINDHFNHGGAPIIPATSASNVAAYLAAIKAARPNVRVHFISGVWYVGENWPLGVNPDDAAVTATLTAIKAVVDATSYAEWMEIRTNIFGIDAPLHNPTHLTNGVMTQGAGDGTHPSKPEGQVVISQRVWKLTSIGL